MDRARDEARRAAIARFAVFLVLVAGCTTPNNQVATNDPLFGDAQPRGVAPTPVAPQQTQSQVPPVPTSRFSNTNAALASAGPLSGGRPTLAIQDNRGTPPANNTPQLAANTKPAPPKVIPLPRQDAPPTVFASNPPAGQPSPSNVVDQLDAALKARGVLFKKHDVVPEGVRFQCIVPSKQNRDATRFFEATGRDYATAVQAVLKKIDEQK